MTENQPMHTVIGTVGNASEFTPGLSESQEIYKEQVEYYFIANEITDDARKKPILYSACRKSTYATLRALATPRQVSEITQDEAIKLLSDYFNPRPSKFVQRLKFNRRDQKTDESLAEIQLQTLSIYGFRRNASRQINMRNA